MKRRKRIRGRMAVFGDLLLEVRNTPGINPTNLQTNLGAMHSTIKKRLDVLKSEGFLKIDVDESNGRKKVYLTDNGRILAYRWASVLKMMEPLNRDIFF